MNNKPIIIDGVNVAGCEFYRMTNMENFYCRSNQKDFSEFCEKNSNCYYKQLQHEKAENEQLKEDLNAMQQTYEACEKEYNALTKRYHELQGVLNANKKRI